MTDTITKAREILARHFSGKNRIIDNDPWVRQLDAVAAIAEALAPAPMSEDEALERAREAAASVTRAKQYRDPEAGLDSQLVIKAAVHALLHAHEHLPVKDEDAPLAYREGIRTAARMVRRLMGDQYGPNSALMIDVDKGVQADKATLAYVLEALEATAARLEERRHG